MGQWCRRRFLVYQSDECWWKDSEPRMVRTRSFGIRCSERHTAVGFQPVALLSTWYTYDGRKSVILALELSYSVPIYLHECYCIELNFASLVPIRLGLLPGSCDQIDQRCRLPNEGSTLSYFLWTNERKGSRQMWWRCTSFVLAIEEKLKVIRLMSDYEVTLVNDNMQEFYVRFHGPTESMMRPSIYSIFGLTW